VLARRKKNGPQAIGRSRGGLSTKIHALVDALGNPARYLLTAGQVHDVTQAEPLLDGIPAQQVVADKAYDSKQLIDFIHSQTAKANIPARAGSTYPRDFDAHDYKARNLVERFFNRIKQFRRIATRYEKLDVRYAAMLTIAAVLIWLA
jgi:transposase